VCADSTNIARTAARGLRAVTEHGVGSNACPTCTASWPLTSPWAFQA
jgi:hypothetical protein